MNCSCQLSAELNSHQNAIWNLLLNIQPSLKWGSRKHSWWEQHLMPVKRKWQEQTSIFTLPSSRFHWSDSGSSYSASITPNLPFIWDGHPSHPIPCQTYSFWLLCSRLARWNLIPYSCPLPLTTLWSMAFCQSKFHKGSPLPKAFIPFWPRGNRLLLSSLL